MQKRHSLVRGKGEGEEALSDEELRSWSRAGRKEGEGEMEVLEKEEEEELQEEMKSLRRGPSIRRDQALVRDVATETSVSRARRRSVRLC